MELFKNFYLNLPNLKQVMKNLLRYNNFMIVIIKYHTLISTMQQHIYLLIIITIATSKVNIINSIINKKNFMINAAVVHFKIDFDNIVDLLVIVNFRQGKALEELSSLITLL